MGREDDDRWWDDFDALFHPEGDAAAPVANAAPGEAPPKVNTGELPQLPPAVLASRALPPSSQSNDLPPLPRFGEDTGPLPDLPGTPISAGPPIVGTTPTLQLPATEPELRGLDGMVATLRQAAVQPSPGEAPPFLTLSTPPPQARLCSSAPPPLLPAPSPMSMAINHFAPPAPYQGHPERSTGPGEVEAQIMGIEGRCSALTKVIRKLLPSKTAGDQVTRLATGPVDNGVKPVDRLREAQARMSALEALIDDLNTGALATDDAWNPSPHPRRNNTRASLSARITLDSGSNFIVGLTRNLSKGGIFIATMDCPAIGTELNMSFDVLGVGVKARGKVTWSLPPERCCDDALPGVGVEFTNISARDLATIDWFMAQHRAPMHLAFSA